MTITVELARRMIEVDPKLREVLFAMLDEMEHQRAQWEASVTKSEFNELAKVVRSLAEAQTRTELHVEELAKAQEKTEQRLDALAQRVEELAEAQKKTEERLDALTARVDALTARVDALAQRVEELAEAQKKTEERLDALTARVDALTIRVDALAQRVEELAEAQKRTEARVEELAAAQMRTEARLDELAQAMRDGFQRINDSIAALGSRWGIQNEVVFRKTIEALLARQGMTVTRGYYGHREVDVVIRNGEHLLLEITSQLRHGDLDKLLASCEDYIQREGVEPKLMVASNYVPPSVMRRILAAPRPIEIISYEEE